MFQQVNQLIEKEAAGEEGFLGTNFPLLKKALRSLKTKQEKLLISNTTT